MQAIMLHLPAGREASPDHGVHRYERHRPEQTLLYPFVEQYYPAFVDQMAAQGATVPAYVQREFDDFLKCGRREYGFLHVRCTGCHQERLVAFSCKHWGFCPSCGARRMAESEEDILPEAPCAVGPQQGRKVFTLQTLPARDPGEPFTNAAGKVAGFSLHAGMAAQAHQREKRERLCRYIARPAIAEKRLSLTAQGKVRYQRKTPYRAMARHMSSSNPWTSLQDWPLWCLSHAST